MRYHEIIAEDRTAYHQYPEVLPDARAIARYIESTASDFVDEEMIEEVFFGCSATLQLVPMSDLREGNADGNVRSKAKEKRYAKLSADTIPPIVVENGEVRDGNHRYRVAKAAGLQAMWAYVVSE